MNRDFDGETVSCEISHATNLSRRDLPPLRVDYGPSIADVSYKGRFAGEALSAECTANGRPNATVQFYLLEDDKERIINPQLYIISIDDDNKFLKCRLGGSKYNEKNEKLRVTLRARRKDLLRGESKF